MGSDKKKTKKSKRHRKRHSSSSSSSSSGGSDTWVEKSKASNPNDHKREDWMAMTGMLKTYTKNDIKPKCNEKKHHIDSYNPSTSVKELNPYWKDGGSGLPQTSQSKSKYMKPEDSDDFYKPRNIKSSISRDHDKHHRNSDYRKTEHHDYRQYRSSTWKKSLENSPKRQERDTDIEKKLVEKEQPKTVQTTEVIKSNPMKKQDDLFLSDEKMNKLAAKIVKAEIMGDIKQAEELKAKLETAKQYRRENPDAGTQLEDHGIMLISTSSTGNSRPLVKSSGDLKSKGGKRKAETYDAAGRNKYFANDDRYNLAQMFQNEKYTSNYDQDAEMANIAAKHTNPNDDLDDIFLDEISKNRNPAKDSERERQKAINEHVRAEKSLDNCEHCLDSKNMIKHLMVSCGSKVYVALPGRKSLVSGQCIITTIHHVTCVTALDEDVWEEIMDYRKALTKFFNSQNKDVVFYETATRLHRFPHLVINCVPIPRDVGDSLPIYFKKALLECEAEWSMNKKVIDLKGKNIRKGVPKGLPYFWIDFGMDPGFAHVIEDQQLFPKTFAEEIIGGIMDLDHSLWMNPQREFGDFQRKKVLDFVNQWKPFDTIVKNTT